MQIKTAFVSLSILSLALGLSACSSLSSDVGIDVEDLGIVVMAPEGYTVEKVVEDGFDIYRVFDGENPVADFEEHEGYDFEMSKLETTAGIQEVMTSWDLDYTVIDEEEGEYGAAVLYETPDTYGVLAGLKYGDTEVVCQAAAGSLASYETTVFDVCKNAVPAL